MLIDGCGGVAAGRRRPLCFLIRSVGNLEARTFGAGEPDPGKCGRLCSDWCAIGGRAGTFFIRVPVKVRIVYGPAGEWREALVYFVDG